MKNEFQDYQVQCTRTAKYKDAACGRLAYVTMGLAGEAGEVANQVKKVFRDTNGKLTPEAREQLIDELGDVLWYVAMVAYELNIPLHRVAGKNLLKLEKRHGGNQPQNQSPPPLPDGTASV